MPNVLFVAHDADYAQTVATGIGYVCSSWLHHLDRSYNVVIHDQGDHTCIELPAALTEADVAAVTHQFVIGRHKLLQKKGAQFQGHPMLGAPFNIEAERDKRTIYAKIPYADRARLEKEGQAFPPHPDLPFYSSISHYKIADAYNDLQRQWLGEDLSAFKVNLRFVLRAFGALPNPMEAATRDWITAMATDGNRADGDVTLLQLVNPTSGKGGNSTKADKIGTGNLSGFWLIEFLKFAGFFGLGAPVLFKSKDRKTYVLRPTQVRLEALDKVMVDFRTVFFPTTSVKTDINAALLFTKKFLEAEQRTIVENQPSSFLALFGAKRPKVTDIAQGFDVTLSKDMGSAFATMNVATINLPDWLQAVEDEAAAKAVLDLLEEHLSVVRSIQGPKGDEGSEEVTLLLLYRDFLSGHDPVTFFDFAAQFGGYVLAKRHRKLPTAQLTTQGMETLVTQPQQRDKLAVILQDEGFQAIARAIRNSTVIAQYYSALAVRNHTSYPYDVRYGLGQELLRAAAYPQTFMAALGEFIQSYNAENARINERIIKKSLVASQRMTVETGHLDAIAKRIDNNGSEVICKMLVAYGYARDPKEQPAGASNNESPSMQEVEGVEDEVQDIEEDESAS